MYSLNMQKGIIERRDEVKEDFDYSETDPTGRYGRFDEVLGKGAMKTVYKAIDEVRGMEVAWNQVKLNDLLQSADDLQRLYSEVHLLSTLHHDSIMKFYTSWIDVDQRTFNFITEMFTSGTLREYRKKYKQLGIHAIKIWARQILSGLVYLHGHDPPVIHRDIKCDNIFVNGHHGLVKIGDLGLAAILRGSHTAHSVIGTPEFMAPEMYEENYNELVDVYSYGMCVLEMVTSEYPYSECSNPVQIYKKVTSGKLPRAFYKVNDLELQQFIGKCLEPASNRLSAEELLLDPFLASDEEELLPVTKVAHQKPFLNENLRIEELQLTKKSSRTNMTITGKLNTEDGAIFLKVKLSDEEGSARNVYFPFDTLSDTPMDVAIEMVKELEITDWEPYEIADMIDAEISLLVPDWEKGHQNQVDNYHILNYHEYNDRHHLCSGSSSSSSSQASFAGMIAPHQMDEKGHGCDWLHDDLSDDTGSWSPRGRGQQHSIAQNSTRFCPEKNSNTRHCHKYNQCNVLVDLQDCSNSKHGWPRNSPRLLRNRSLVDMRSQLLHRTLVEEVNKRRLFKTAGAVEDVGFQPPIGRSYSQRNTSDGKSQRQKGRRELP